MRAPATVRSCVLYVLHCISAYHSQRHELRHASDVAAQTIISSTALHHGVGARALPVCQGAAGAAHSAGRERAVYFFERCLAPPEAARPFLAMGVWRLPAAAFVAFVVVVGVAGALFIFVVFVGVGASRTVIPRSVVPAVR